MSTLEKLIQLQASRVLPAAERRDVNRELLDGFLGGMSRADVIPVEEFQQMHRDLAAQTESMAKAVVLASQYRPQAETERGGRKSVLYVNELGVQGQGADPWCEKPHNASGFEFLGYMHDALDIDQLAVRLREHQVASYCRPYDENDDNPLGYRWMRRDGVQLGPEDKRTTDRLDRFLANCGTEADPIVNRWDLRRPRFAGFMQKLVHDSLVFDACPVETERTNDGRIAGLYNLDPRTIRLAYESGYLGDDRVVAVQLAPNERQAWLGYERDEIIYAVRNPRSNVYYGDYGSAELEGMVKIATAYLNSFTFNAANQDRNSIPRGFLTLYGRFGPKALGEFRNQWNTMVRGAAKRWNLPVLVSESKQEGGAVYTPVDTANQEMYLAKWITFLTSMTAAFRGVDPLELNLASFSPSQSSLSGKDTAEKLQSSHDRGFIPLMLWLQAWLNDHLVSGLSDKYRLGWVGLFPADEERKFERQKLTLTVNEMRGLDGEDEHPDEDIGNAPVNPVHMSVYSMKLQQQMMQEQQAQMGAGGMGGEDDGGDQFGLPGGDQHLRGQYDEGEPGGKPGGPAPGPGGNLPALPAPGGAPPMAKARLVVTIRDLGARP